MKSSEYLDARKVLEQFEATLGRRWTAIELKRTFKRRASFSTAWRW